MADRKILLGTYIRFVLVMADLYCPHEANKYQWLWIINLSCHSNTPQPAAPSFSYLPDGLSLQMVDFMATTFRLSSNVPGGYYQDSCRELLPVPSPGILRVRAPCLPINRQPLALSKQFSRFHFITMQQTLPAPNVLGIIRCPVFCVQLMLGYSRRLFCSYRGCFWNPISNHQIFFRNVLATFRVNLPRHISMAGVWGSEFSETFFSAMVWRSICSSALKSYNDGT
jgi:hypothetical protein